MSRRALGWAVVLGVWLTPHGLGAQQSEAELRQHLDSLRPIVEAARLEAQAAWDAEEAKARGGIQMAHVDTFSVGPLRIIAPVEQRALAEEVYAAAWSDFAPFVNDLLLADSTYLTFAWPLTDGKIHVEGDVIRMEAPWWRTGNVVQQRTRQAIGTLLAREIAGTRLGSWLTSDIQPPADPADTYRRLALRQSASIRDCLSGNADRCWTAMGADLDLAVYPLPLWYSPEERQAKVRPARYLAREPGPTASLYETCLAGTIGSCDEILQQMPFENWNGAAPTYGGGSRGTFLWMALSAGGAGAWDRLRTHKDDAPGDALRAASGLEAGPLAERWLEWLQANRPKPRRTFDPNYLFAFAWLALFVAFAMRSERCRLG